MENIEKIKSLVNQSIDELETPDPDTDQIHTNLCEVRSLLDPSSGIQEKKDEFVNNFGG
jgi:hypothetical protein